MAGHSNVTLTGNYIDLKENLPPDQNFMEIEHIRNQKKTSILWGREGDNKSVSYYNDTPIYLLRMGGYFFPFKNELIC